MIEKRLINTNWIELAPSRKYRIFTKKGYIILVYFDGTVNLSFPSGKIVYDLKID